MRKRYYIFMVTHDWDGQLRRVPIPVKWVALFVACAVVGAGTLLGLAGSYGRMLTKVQAFNELRTRQDMLVQQLSSARHDADQFQAEVASLGSLASEVSTLYSFKHSASFKDRVRNSSSEATLAAMPTEESGAEVLANAQASELYNNTLNTFQILESTALENSLPHRQWSPFGPGIWQPDQWPVRGRITSSFGERIDPFQGEGAFHSGLDIAVGYGTPIHVTADGMVVYAGVESGYGRTVIVDHGHGIQTLYAHMSGMAVTVGQHVDRDEIVGFVGESGRTTGAHLHYEVRINKSPVNPYRYLHP
ncbi:MAG TPA: peptidoglycan DD-metalloendopeptidase family protein [Terriglobales bacterium]|nr:peptidoglycan DD-metalloendopeptidase family protein [Terriglobales bacterium]